MDGPIFSAPRALSAFAGSGPGFPEPFFDMASLAMPQTIPSALQWCEFIASSQGNYRAALERINAYFITDVKVDGEDVGDDEKSEIREYLVDELKVLDHAFLDGLDEDVYGNSFTSVVESFTRSFFCKNGRCRLELEFDPAFQLTQGRPEWKDFALHLTCPKCGVRGPWAMHDRRGGADDSLKIKHWSPHEIEIVFDDFTERCRYIWKIPEDYRRNIRLGRPQSLKYAPAVVIEAVRTNQHVLFADGFVHHSKEATLAGIRNHGWGIPRILANFRQSWYLQVLHRFNEALALDYIVPIRVLSPEAGGSGVESNDPLARLGAGSAAGRVEQMMAQHRRDPGTMHYFPYPVRYQQLGGEASQLAPYQLIDQGFKSLLNACNIPLELYDMTLSMQAAGPALRLFESAHRGVVSSRNSFIQFVSDRAGRIRDWPRAKAGLVPTTIVDDLAKQMPKLDLMANGVVSPQTGLATIGLNAEEEARKVLEFQVKQQELQEQIQAQLEQEGAARQIATPPFMQLMTAQQGGQPGTAGAGGGAAATGPAGAPPASGAAAGMQAQAVPPPDMPTDPREVVTRARAMAQELAGMPNAQKNMRLRAIKSQNPLMHDAVTSALDDIRSEAASQGRDMVMQQQFGKAGKAGGLMAHLAGIDMFGKSTRTG